jgi:hypothetical protein
VFCVLVTDVGTLWYGYEIPSIVSMKVGTAIVFDCIPKTL